MLIFHGVSINSKKNDRWILKWIHLNFDYGFFTLLLLFLFLFVTLYVCYYTHKMFILFQWKFEWWIIEMSHPMNAHIDWIFFADWTNSMARTLAYLIDEYCMHFHIHMLYFLSFLAIGGGFGKSDWNRQKFFLCQDTKNLINYPQTVSFWPVSFITYSIHTLNLEFGPSLFVLKN